MKHIDKLFKEKLYNHEVEVPEGMWDKIAPIAEEESGRAILWFWLTGLLTLLLGGYGIYKMVTSTHDTNSTTLVHQNASQATPQDNITDNSLVKHPVAEEEKDELAVELSEINNEIKQKETLNAQKNTEVKSSENITIAKPALSNNTTPLEGLRTNNEAIGSTVESISNTVETIDNTVGVPANLVITKSYINKDGSVIRQSDLNSESGNEIPVYDVIINSEAKDLNAGTLLRIIEPLENIPLPAFQKTLKKKTPITIL